MDLLLCVRPFAAPFVVDPEREVTSNWCKSLALLEHLESRQHGGMCDHVQWYRRGRFRRIEFLIL